ncbi:extracellular metallo proteinase 2 [Massarina eburnea CBS 473.64]|uniref:Extracellular metalloproteinase n=1 Tax=Massarina eburnea CBS 473.64 TaxID=1395130 RepID=A0A6A6SBF8_9PLEO|nr:extracellular metallo proteinase 2 [Massarina eburnea CBS 473.64]
MRSFLLGSLAALVAQNVYAHPTHSGISVSDRMLSRRAVDLNAFRGKIDAAYKNSGNVNEDPSIQSLSKRAEPKEVATELVKKTSPGASFRLQEDSYTSSSGVSHFYFKQTINDLDIDNADLNVNIAKSGKVFSYGSTFFNGEIPSDLAKEPTVDPAEALKTAVDILQLPITAGSATAKSDGEKSFVIEQTTGTVSAPKAALTYVQTDQGSVALAWKVTTDIDTNYLYTYVDATEKGKIHHVVDLAADATYEVYPWGLNDPTEGTRQVITDPWDTTASPLGWHSTGDESFKTTWGNNAQAQDNSGNKPQSQYSTLPRPSSDNLTFEYPYSLTETDYHSYINASVTQLFYTSNTYHDLLYLLGFNEAAGNFQVNTNGKGGKGEIFWFNSQDGAGFNNANYAPSVDGSPGRVRMYIWDSTTPFRDGSFEAGIVIHEYTHGLSTRLTGGPATASCLNLFESGGMGEGWGDFYATAIRLKAADTRSTDYTMGEWASGRANGIRTYKYSTSLTTNPHVYNDVDALASVHAVGTVWATILYEVLWNLIDKHGKNDAAKPTFDSNGVPTDGKYLLLKLVLDGMALQPCNPTIVTARDAIIDADEALTGGDNKCEIWNGFAKRGVGVNAKYSSSKRTNDFTVPSGC